MKKNWRTLPSIYILKKCNFVRKYSQFYTKIKGQALRRVLKNNLTSLTVLKWKVHRLNPNLMAIKIYNKLSDQLITNEQFNTLKAISSKGIFFLERWIFKWLILLYIEYKNYKLTFKISFKTFSVQTLPFKILYF